MGDYAEVKFTGNESFISRLIKSIRGLVEEPGGEPLETKSATDKTAISLVKAQNGKWFWFARYSNKYLDDDYPREIIAEESHLNFVKEVNEGKHEFPELWLHHIPGTAWGKAEWVGYSDGFAMAAGYVYPEHNDLAEAMANKSGLLLSHGMDPDSIVRDEQNPNIILRHATMEISPLPAQRAANKLTGFVILEEDNMKEKGLSDIDRKTLIDMGAPEEWIQRIESDNQTLKRIAEALELPSKEAADQEGEEVEQVEALEEEVEETPEEPEVEAAVVDNETVDAIIESIKALSDRVDVIANYVKSIGERQEELNEKQEKIVGESTKASRMSILDSVRSVIGTEDAYVDGRTTLAKSGPKETKSNSKQPFFFQQEGWT